MHPICLETCVSESDIRQFSMDHNHIKRIEAKFFESPLWTVIYELQIQLLPVAASQLAATGSTKLRKIFLSLDLKSSILLAHNMPKPKPCTRARPISPFSLQSAPSVEHFWIVGTVVPII